MYEDQARSADRIDQRPDPDRTDRDRAHDGADLDPGTDQEMGVIQMEKLIINYQIPKIRKIALEKLWNALGENKIQAVIHHEPDLHGAHIWILGDDKEPYVSIICHDYSYGAAIGLFESAIIGEDDKLHSVTGFQTVKQVIDTIKSAM